MSYILKFKEKKNQLHCLPSNLQYKVHISRQYNCWSLRCIFILDLMPSFNGLGKDKMRNI